MGFYIRKSIRVGPLRFNLSRSGIGMSAGIKGLRFGTGPRGNYVHMGAGGLYYRQSLNPSRLPQPRGFDPTAGHQPPTDRTVGPMIDIESGSAAEMVDSSAIDLLADITAAKQRSRLAGWVALASAVLVGIAVNAGDRPEVTVIVGVICCGLVWYTHQRDLVRKTAVLFYEFDADSERRYQQLLDGFGALAASERVWHVASEAHVHDAKYHAGASKSIRRTTTRPTLGQPPNLKINIDVPLLRVGRQLLVFTPERVLVFDGSDVGAVAYQDLHVGITSTRFIEPDGVPSDAQVVERTWRYVNKKGGPDRRFANNPQLPICLYDEFYLHSDSGLHEVVQASKVGSSSAFGAALRELQTRGRELTT